MTTLTATQITDLRGDLGIPVGAVFTDAQLQRFYDRANSDYDSALVYAWRNILASATVLHDYTAAQSGESLSQVFANVEKALARAEKISGLGGAKITASSIGLNIDSTSDNETEWDNTATSP